jgi:phage/conjugal plasmid C-4 type zinc finger TraR family protein
MDEFDRAQELEQRQRDEALARVQTRLVSGPSSEECSDCGDEIPEARRQAIPGVSRCVICQNKFEKKGRR